MDMKLKFFIGGCLVACVIGYFIHPLLIENKEIAPQQSAQVKAPSRAAELPKQHHSFIEDNCLKCHNNDKKKGKVNLESLPFRITNVQDAELWQDVLDAVNAGDMPP